MTRSNVEVPYPYNDSPATLAKQQAWQEVVNAKLSVSVTDFGAVGDGVTDDTQAIQDAIDSLAATGGRVWFPKGVYLLDTVTSAGGYYWCLSVVTDNVHLDFEVGTTLKTTQDASVIMAVGSSKVDGPEEWKTYRVGDPTTATYYDIDPVAKGDVKITLDDSGDAANFAVGDHIYIRTGQLVDRTGLDETDPTEPDSEINVVTSIDGADLYLETPTVKPYAQENYISGSVGKSSTSGAGSALTFGVAKITDRILSNFKITDLTLDVGDIPNAGSAIRVQTIDGLKITGLRGSTGGNAVDNIECRNVIFDDWQVISNPSTTGKYRWLFAFGTGCSYGSAKNLRGWGNGNRMFIGHVHEGTAKTDFENITIVSPEGDDDITPWSVRARGYDQNYKNIQVFSEGSQSPFYISSEVQGPGTLDTIRAVCSDSAKGISVQAKGWKYKSLVPEQIVNMSGDARFPGVPGQIEWFYGTVTYDNPTVILGQLPANSLPIAQLLCLTCTTVFNSDGNDRITIGYDGGAEQAYLISAAALDVGTTGRKDITSSHYGSSAGIFAGTTRTVKAYYTYSGSTPTSGVARVAFAYIRMPGAT